MKAWKRSCVAIYRLEDDQSPISEFRPGTQAQMSEDVINRIVRYNSCL